MKRFGTKKTKIAVTFVAVGLMLFLTSCNSYRYGFINLPTQSKSVLLKDPDLLRIKKDSLTNETVRIITSLEAGMQKKQAFNPWALNRLFQNYHNHLQIDSCYHSLLKYAENESAKEFARTQLIESAAKYHQLFQIEKNLRRVINRGDKAFQVGKKSLLNSQKFLWAVPNRELLKKQIPEKEQRHSKCWFVSQECVDNTYNCQYKMAGFFSEIFSRSIAHIHKKPEPEKNISRLMPHLQKWDIIIQKSPERLTDKFIPGHFGHAAIYMGDSLFIEGLQNGVVTNNPTHFAEGGSFLIIRLKEISEEKETRIRQLAMGQIGKKYDYNFDVGSPDKLVCTELIYIVYEDLNWRTKKQAGVFTLSPDGIIRTAIASDKFYFPLYFNEEQLVENPDPEFLESLLLVK